MRRHVTIHTSNGFAVERGFLLGMFIPYHFSFNAVRWTWGLPKGVRGFLSWTAILAGTMVQWRPSTNGADTKYSYADPEMTISIVRNANDPITMPGRIWNKNLCPRIPGLPVA